MLEAAEPLDRDQHKLARFYMTASSVLKRLMTTHNLFILSTARATLSLGSWGPQPGWLPSQKPGSLPILKVRLPSGSATCCPCPKDALSWAPSEPHEVSLTGRFFLSCRKIGRYHPTAALKRLEKLEKSVISKTKPLYFL